MHVQVKTPVKTAAFADEVEDDEPSVEFPRFALSEVLTILAEDRSPNDPGFDLASAGGRDIELGGDFSFWAKPRDGVDQDHEEATLRAMARLQEAGYDARQYHVQAKHIDDTKGALLAFVNEVSGRGHHIIGIDIGGPEDHGIPVQIYTAKQ